MNDTTTRDRRKSQGTGFRQMYGTPDGVVTPWGTHLFTIPVHLYGSEPPAYAQEQEAEDTSSVGSPEVTSDSEESPPG